MKVARFQAWALLLLCTTIPATARPPVEEPPDAEPLTYRVARAISEITIDGLLNEDAWAEALSLELDYEVRPGENTKPPVRTVLLATYDDRNVYFAFQAYDPDPAKIRARFTDRDQAWNDDWVGVVLDTFNDQRRAYELICNPLGVQMDAINDDVSQRYDDSWNAIWKSAGRITEKGYEVELAIPYNQIRFQASNGEPQTWGFDAVRSYPRSDRHHIGIFPRDRGNNSYLSQTIKLVGMGGASPGKNIEIMPTLTGSRTDSRDELPNGNLESGDEDAELGATVRWGITPNVSLNGAVNPDFSQVEADVLTLNINEQFALYYPETRPFFLEQADYFTTPLNLVHTRTLADPNVAAKVTGKQGRHTYGVFAAQDDITNMIFPGAQGSSGGSYNLETLGTVARYRYDFGRNSTAGATITDRRGDDYFNQVASIDTTLRFTEADRLTLNLAASKTRYSEQMIEDAGVRDDTFSDHTLSLEYLHTVRDWWVVAEYIDYGEGFRSDLGFRPQVDYRGWYVGGAKIWWGEEGDFHRRMAWGGAAGGRRQQDGSPLREHIESWWNINGPKQSHANINVTLRNESFEGVDFDDQLFVHSWLEIEAGSDLHLTFHQDYGDWIDYDNVRPGKRTLIQPGIRYNLGRHFLLRLNHTYTSLDVDDGRLFRVHAPEARLIYQFNTRAFVRAVLQYTDIEKDVSLYDDEVEPRTKELFAQLLVTYKVNPQTAVYVGYGDVYNGAVEYDLTRSSRSFFVKLAYAWVR
jgi:hypothetical protein